MKAIYKEFQRYQDSKKAKILSRFFKTGKGEYAEGDQFLGIVVPTQRKIAKKYKDISAKEIEKLLQSPTHEHRLTGLFILVDQFKQHTEKQKQIVEMYLRNTKNINNWDLVDLSAPTILGMYLFDKDKTILYTLAQSKDIWKRRISIMSTFYFIRKNQYDDTIKIAEILLYDPHDLIHKAVGWMLREIGKRNQKREEKFLKKYAKEMPRTMLRYAIEKFDEQKRQQYLSIKKIH